VCVGVRVHVGLRHVKLAFRHVKQSPLPHFRFRRPRHRLFKTLEKEGCLLLLWSIKYVSFQWYQYVPQPSSFQRRP
jgi:hypothetical protein